MSKDAGLPLIANAFTLIELLVSMTVLTLIVALVGQLIGGATKVTTSNRQHLDADSQARLTFDRLAIDIGRMLRRPDVDYMFSRPTGGSSLGANDRMFFYSEAPAFYDGDSSTLQSRSSLALLGYRINAAYQLERLGKLLTWDGIPANGAAGSSAPGGIMFLSCPSATLNPDPLSTLAGNWPATLGSASDSPPYNGSDDDYHVLAAGVFRLEICYLLKAVQLKDGTYSAATYAGVPVANPSDRTNNLTATRAPQASDDTAAGYIAGSRWYDTSGERAYICVNNAAGAAGWNPLGVQDVAAIVVAIAVLDPASAGIVATTPATINGLAVLAPNLANLVGAFADVPLTASAAANNTVPDLTITPPRLMDQAWTNALLSSGFAQTVKLPPAVVSQVRIYQRCFPLNGD
jgi:prepilin-type N-terminal cleavage/methylation domain-containing protein